MIEPSSRQTFITALVLFILLAVGSPATRPLARIGLQIPFNFPEPHDNPARPIPSVASHSSLDVALKELEGASQQVIDTFEAVMSELGSEVSTYLIWSLPHKNVRISKHKWDFEVSSNALPEHSLRVKVPNSLGVDDVKQVRLKFVSNIASAIDTKTSFSIRVT